MKTILTKKKIQTVEYKHLTFKMGDFTLKEIYTDGVLTSQEWLTPTEKMTHFKWAYEPKRIYFKYYPDISFLDKVIDGDIDAFYSANSDMVDSSGDIDLSHVLCNYIHMDSTFFNLKDRAPISFWKKQDYIGGITNEDFDLNLVLAKMKKSDKIRNASIKNIPYYNAEKNRNKFIEFEYFSALKMTPMYDSKNCIRSKSEIIVEF